MPVQTVNTAGALDNALGFVEVKRGDSHAAARGDLAPVSALLIWLGSNLPISFRLDRQLE